MSFHYMYWCDKVSRRRRRETGETKGKGKKIDEAIANGYFRVLCASERNCITRSNGNEVTRGLKGKNKLSVQR